MQFEFPFAHEDRLERVHQALQRAFGKPPPAIRLDPVSQLVLTMLSARTKDRVAKTAFAKLANKFPDWQALAQTPPGLVECCIRPVTFSERKAVFLPQALQRIQTLRKTMSLDFLQGWPLETALSWLQKLPGVGPKTSAAVLNFSPLQMPALVVDTAHYRAARRIGLIPQETSLGMAAHVMKRQIPPDWTSGQIEDHHVLMQALGKNYCTHIEPDCCNCPVRHLCGQGSAASA